MSDVSVSLPTITIVTPSYNQSAYLEQAILSVLEQGYENLEYMVVDGGSFDGSQDIIKHHASRLAWWVSEPDRGQAEAVNKGFNRASGEIVGWLNSDDLYRPGALSQVVKAFQEHPEAGLVFSDVDSIDSNGGLINIMSYGSWGLADLMAFKIIGQPGVFMRRAVLTSAGYLNPDYHYLLDHHLWLRMANLAPMQYVPGARWSAARFHVEAKNRAHAVEFGKEAYRLADWMLSDPGFAPRAVQMRRKIWAGAHRLNAFYLLDGGRPADALRAYWRAFWQNPAVVLPDWRRVLYAFFSPLGLGKMREAYLEKRRQGLQGRSSERRD